MIQDHLSPMTILITDDQWPMNHNIVADHWLLVIIDNNGSEAVFLDFGKIFQRTRSASETSISKPLHIKGETHFNFYNRKIYFWWRNYSWVLKIFINWKFSFLKHFENILQILVIHIAVSRWCVGNPNGNFFWLSTNTSSIAWQTVIMAKPLFSLYARIKEKCPRDICAINPHNPLGVQAPTHAHDLSPYPLPRYSRLPWWNYFTECRI
jgi:hypothetical protein